MTSRLTSCAAARIPSRPPSATTGSVAMPTVCWTSRLASPSRRLTDRPSSVCPAAPSSFSGACVCAASQDAELQRGPVVLGAPERDEDRRARPDLDRIALAGDEDRDVAGRLLQDLPDLAERHALAEDRPAALDEHEVDLLGLGQPDEVRARVGGREGDAARGDSGRREPAPGLCDLARRAAQQRVLGLEPAAHGRRVRRLDQPRQDQLARRRRSARAAPPVPAAAAAPHRSAGRRVSSAPARACRGTRRRPRAEPPRAPPRPACRTRSWGREAAAAVPP